MPPSLPFHRKISFNPFFFTGRAYKKLLYNRRFVNVVVGKRGGPNSNADK
jgi:hypothetical protein